ncbi:MAG: chromosome segregation protein SMC [Candidatus Omnitrophica bacterium]|nr:chromosome segregation protein SMC [Candidatus Omnitrophota bacterium]
MYLKKLELFGFKSFGDKAELFFEPGITAIVGPNGCGKSNISDAIRWVLGEDNARSLRGERMDDLIFNGAGERSGVGFAEVSLVLDNSARILPVDYSEVEITRKLYRSGESEYLINRTPCRLRDIRDLLMDTGIGVDSYSVVGQGSMDRILSSKPEDRREVFEEAAGITKYKSRKHEALLKLERTEENIQRVNDIIQEVRRQVASIGRQAGKARQYEAKRETLKDLELKRAACEIERVKRAWDSAHGERELLRAEEKSLSERNLEAEACLKRARHDFEEGERGFSALRVELGQANAGRLGLEDRRGLNHDRIQELEKEAVELKRESVTLEARVEETARRRAEEEGRIQQEEEERIHRVAAVEKTRAELFRLEQEIKDGRHTIEEWKIKSMEAAGRMAHVRNELAQLTAELGTQRIRRRRIAQELDSIEKERQAASGALQTVHEKLREREQGLRSIRRELEENQKEERDLEAKRARLHMDWVQAREEHSRAQSKREFLESLVERHEGFSQGVREILEAVKRGEPEVAGVRGVLADLIRVPRGREGWVEMALGQNIQAVVCDTRASALMAARALRSRKAGRARFYSLDHIPAAPPSGDLEGWQPLLEGVETPRDIEPLLKNLLGRAWGGMSVEEVWPLCGNGPDPRSAWVTREGEVIRGTGSLEGGTAFEDAHVSLLSRHTQIEDLSTRENGLGSRIQELSNQEGELKEAILNLKGRGSALRDELQEGELIRAGLAGEAERGEASLKKLTDEHDLLTLEGTETLTDIQDLENREKTIRACLEDEARQDRELQSLIFKNQKTLEEAQAGREGLVIELTQMETELGTHEARAQARTSAIAHLGAMSREQEETLAQRRERLGVVVRRREELAAENSGLEKDLKAYDAQIRALEEGIESGRSGRDAAQAEIGKRESELGSLRTALNEVRNKIRDLDVNEARVRFEEQSIRDRILEVYQVDLFAVTLEIPGDFDPDAAQAEVSRLKVQMEKMGEVNLVAAQEEKDLSERDKFLTSQKEDLEAARASIHQAINKINQTTRALFMDTFAKIQEHFQDYFTILFGGGAVQLVLLDEKNVLDSGIEIMAKPPGKKLRSITLLSGGERSLTATALMFALFKVRPSPFSVLDEIDAPLDEANIGRFTQVLEDFTRESQFIVITHNRKTIGISDSIYGVTMEESGVSKIVSIKLNRSGREGVVIEEEAATQA